MFDNFLQCFSINKLARRAVFGSAVPFITDLCGKEIFSQPAERFENGLICRWSSCSIRLSVLCSQAASQSGAMRSGPGALRCPYGESGLQNVSGTIVRCWISSWMRRVWFRPQYLNIYIWCFWDFSAGCRIQHAGFGWFVEVFTTTEAEPTQHNRQNQTENASKSELQNVGNEEYQEMTWDHAQKEADCTSAYTRIYAHTSFCIEPKRSQYSYTKIFL